MFKSKKGKNLDTPGTHQDSTKERQEKNVLKKSNLLSGLTPEPGLGLQLKKNIVNCLEISTSTPQSPSENVYKPENSEK